jgi:UDP-N-acetylmuramoylalanine--D-glutamate ligase
VKQVDLRNREVLVVGTKRSGQAAIDLLLKDGARVRAMDEKEPGPEEKAFLEARSVPLSTQSIKELGVPDLIVLSPAVPSDSLVVTEARLRGIPVIGEVELASHYLKGKVIGITGSNGKTTTTALTGHLLAECGIECQVGGNIGTAVTSLIATSSENRWNVLELSSFQLETICRFRANIASCLNVTPDHLDRHHTFESYANAKARLFETQQTGDSAVLNFEDDTCRSFALRTKAQVLWFSSKQRLPSGMWPDGDNLMLNDRQFMSRSEIRLRGLHNVENVMAAALVAWLAGAGLEDLRKAVTSFPGVEHRIEFVRNFNGIEYYNDSKATNVDATLKALEAFSGNIWVILGGKDKGSDYRPLAEPLRQRAKAALLIGSAAGKIKNDLQNALPLIESGTMAEAIAYTREHADTGDIVLLAPACASFDQFDNFEHRGNVFKQLVAELL